MGFGAILCGPRVAPVLCERHIFLTAPKNALGRDHNSIPNPDTDVIHTKFDSKRAMGYFYFAWNVLLSILKLVRSIKYDSPNAILCPAS